jgi:hypothetical protein
MKKVNVSIWKKKQSLVEIYQVLGIQYAFLSADNIQCHAWIKCRDFLHDALRCHITGKKEGIYGFSYNPGDNPPLDLGKMRMLVKREPPGTELRPSRNTKKILGSALEILQCVEEYSGIKPLSELYHTAENKDVYIFEGASDWMESTFMISLYTFLIRLGAKKIEFKDKKDLDAKLKKLCAEKVVNNDRDLSYLKTVLPFIYKIVEKRKELRYVREDGKRLFDGQTINLFHNYTGIVALSKQAAEKNPGRNNAKLEDLITLSKHMAA